MTQQEQHPTLYQRLTEPFDPTYSDTRGGVAITYITGEQVITRLNQVLGPGHWAFAVREHGFNQEADEYWVLGSLRALLDGEWVSLEQFGSQKVKRARATGSPLDIGFDLKGASTDALKKCATLIGVGLYLSQKEAPAESAEQRQPAQQKGGSRSQPQAATLTCDECGEELAEVAFRDGTKWTAPELATRGKRKFGKKLCMSHYKEANSAKQAPAVA